jgi:hypothetical protein
VNARAIERVLQYAEELGALAIRDSVLEVDLIAGGREFSAN